MSEPFWAELFAGLPPLRGLKPELFSIQRLPGLTNRNYRLRGQGVDYVLRLPGAGSKRYIDRHAEWHNLQQAIQLGLAPEWVYADPDSGLLLSRYLPDRSLEPADLHRDSALEQAVSLLQSLHQSKAEFKGRWPWFATLEQNLRWSSPEWRSELTELLEIAERWRPEMEHSAPPLCACHCDPNPANFRVGADSRLWLLDWEYSAQAEPAWDLATLALEAGLDTDRLVCLYAGTSDFWLLRRVCLHRFFLDLLAAAWSAAQVGLGNQAVRTDAIPQRLQRARLGLHSL